MKRLEEISKKIPFEVPDGYFDQLPSNIQARIAGKKRHHLLSWHVAMRLAVPTFLLAIVGLFWFRKIDNNSFSVVTELEKIEEQQLAQFLSDTDITTDELVENITWNAEDILELEDKIYSSLPVSDEQLEDLPSD
jgi:hypothetical protein